MNLKKLLLIILSVLLVYTGIPLILFVLIILPLALLRKCVSYMGKRKWGWIPLSIQSCATAVDDIYNKPRANCLTVFLNKGPLPMEKFEERVQALVDDKEKWPELTMTLTWWLGTYFWKPCHAFAFHEHVQSISDCTSQEELDSKISDEIHQPFKEGTPLWKFIAFPNYKDLEGNCESALVFKFHHSLADGFGMMSFLRAVTDTDQQMEANIEKHLNKAKERMRPTGLTKVWFLLRLLFVTPVELVYTIFDSLDSNPWTTPYKRQAGEMTVSCNMKAIDVDWLKKIAKSCDSQITTLIFNSVTMAMAKCMESQKDFSVIYPLPYPGHPGTLSNHMIPTFMKAPVAIRDRQQRLKSIVAQFQRKIFTPFPLGTLAVVYLECLLNSFFRTEGLQGQWGTGIVSNFVFKSEPSRIFGTPIMNCTAVAGLQRKFFNFVITCVSYNGNLNIVITTDKGVFPSEKEAQGFVECMKEELADCAF